MKFVINTTVVERALSKVDLPRHLMIPIWVNNNLVDDYTLKTSTLTLLKTLLKESADSVDKLSRNFKTTNQFGLNQYSIDERIRLFVLAYMMTNHEIKWNDYCAIRDNDPAIYERLTSFSQQDGFLTLYFEELEE